MVSGHVEYAKTKMGKATRESPREKCGSAGVPEKLLAEPKLFLIPRGRQVSCDCEKCWAFSPSLRCLTSHKKNFKSTAGGRIVSSVEKQLHSPKDGIWR